MTLFVKPCAPPIYLLKLNALKARVPDNHPKKAEVDKECDKNNAEYQGEKSLDYYLSFLEDSKYFILHDLRLKNEDKFFQIDILMLTLRYGLIIDSKNISGELEFDSINSQLIKMVNEKKEVLGDPFVQVRHQMNQLIDFSNKNNLPPLHFDYLVALSNKNALIKKITGRNGEFRKLSRGSTLLEKIQSIESALYTDAITEKELKKICKLLLKCHTPYNPDVLKRFNIQKKDILTGVHCPHCGFLPMKHIFGKWLCPKCNYHSKDAHVQAVNDYFLLFGATISNKDFRWFTQIDKCQIATNLLSAMNLNVIGANKGRVYSQRK